MIHPIVYWPSKSLSQVAVKVTDFDESVIQLAKDLSDSMMAHDGIGLAAPQIGIQKQAFCIAGELLDTTTYFNGPQTSLMDGNFIFINPEIIARGSECSEQIEGCLSFPGIFINIERPLAVTLRAQDVSGQVFQIETAGMFATAIQHEHDHCQGLTMMDYVGNLRKSMVTKKVLKWRNKHGV